MAKTKTPYVDGAKLQRVMTEYYHALKKSEDDGSEQPRIPEFVGESIVRICNNLGRCSNFARYSYKDEMVDDAITACCYGVTKFNPTKENANAFNYLTTISWQAFLQRIDREKKQNYIRHHNFVRSFSSIDGSVLEVAGDANEVSNRVVEEFEAKAAARREKQAKRKAARLETQNE